jgi:two-component system, NarL family, response regulator LiaR
MINVLIAEDHQLVGETMRRMLDGEDGISCVGLATDGVEAVRMVADLRPDVVVMDIHLPKMNGIEATRRIKSDFPSVAVLVLTAYDYEEYVIASLEAGADGFVLKSTLPCDGLLGAIRMVSSGSGVFGRDAVSSLRKLVAAGATQDCVPKLGDREREVLSLAAQGMTTRQIGIALSISDLTVHTHFNNIFKKLGVQSRLAAVMFAVKKGWVPDVDLRPKSI